MATVITRGKLISMLRENMMGNDCGWNLAVIHLLKYLKPEREKETHMLSDHKLTQEDIAEIDECCKRQHKLAGVKRLKEITGLGLKEAKDLFELYYDSRVWDN